jgi:hypothetical protein
MPRRPRDNRPPGHPAPVSRRPGPEISLRCPSVGCSYVARGIAAVAYRDLDRHVETAHPDGIQW